MTKPAPGLVIAPAIAVDRELTALDQYLHAAGGILRDGHMPDLTGLDRRIAALCQSVLALPEIVRKTYLARLQALVRQLDHCNAGLRAVHQPAEER